MAQAHRAAADFIEQTVKEESIDCDFVRLDGYLYPHDSSNSTFRTLEKELQASIEAGTTIAGQRNLSICILRWILYTDSVKGDGLAMVEGIRLFFGGVRRVRR